jgi:DNA polymerase-3 subunit alpha
MRDLLTKMKPDKFEDIIATSALYRPGPLEGGMVMQYVDVKNGRKEPEKIHPIIDEVLAETYGVMVYQEQVMRILNRMGGIELAESYKCIKAISKKKLDTIAKYKEQFVAGSVSQGMSSDQATEIFGLIEKFAGYGFNKSHSTAYGAIAYQTAYLKAHYAEEFMAALLSCGMESSERINEHTDDCRRMGIEILPPDINRSDVEFSVIEIERKEVKVKGKKSGDKEGSASVAASSPVSQAVIDRKISFGLGAIKGVGEQAMRAMVEERQANGPFANIFDLCERVDPKLLTKGSVEILIKAGCLDSLGPNRPQHLAVVDRAFQAAASKFRDKARGQKSLFGDPAPGGQGGPESSDVSIPPADDWTHSQKLNSEKEVLGFYLTSHPLTEFADQIESFSQSSVQDIRELGDGKDVLIGGMISSIKKATTKNPSRNGNSKYVNFDLEDATGVVRCIMWPDDYAKEGEKIEPEAIVIVKGRIDARGREPNIICNKVMTLEEAEKEFTRQIALKFRNGYHTEADMQRVREILNRFPGKTPVVIIVETWEGSSGGGRKGTSAVRTGAMNGNGHSDHDDGEEVTESMVAVAESPSESRKALRAVIATTLQVTARAELKQELINVLGTGGFRFQAANPGAGGGGSRG